MFVSRPFAEDTLPTKISVTFNPKNDVGHKKRTGEGWEEILRRPNWDDRDVNGGDDQRITVKVGYGCKLLDFSVTENFLGLGISYVVHGVV